MKYFLPRNWNSENRTIDGILFFTQRINEMLFHYILEKYKAPILNTHLLLEEYLDVHQGDPKGWVNLPIILSELSLTLSRDPVINHFFGQQYVSRTLAEIHNSSKERLPKLLNLLNTSWGQPMYLELCLQYALEVIPENIDFEKIDAMLDCLIPELIANGYSSEFIFRYNNDFFQSKSNASIEGVKTFLSRFDLKMHKYSVYFSTDPKILNFQEVLETKLDIVFEDDGLFGKLKHSPNQIVFCIKDVECLDDYSAAIQAYSRINIFLRFYSAITNEMSFQFCDKAMVFAEDAQAPVFVPYKQFGFSVKQEYDADLALTITTETINSILSERMSVYPDLKRILTLHNASLDAQDYNNCFLNLWSILEILTLENKSIDGIKEVMVSLLVKDYFHSCLFFIDEQFKNVIGEANYSSLFNSASADIFEFSEFIFYKTKNPENEWICEYLKKYPVLKYRIECLAEISKDCDKILKLLDDYKKRVDWQIHRMYRTRNLIVHSGKVPYYIKPIGDHLHAYVDYLINELLGTISFGYKFISIDNVLLNVILSEKSLRKALTNKKISKEEIIKAIIDPKYLPIVS